MGLSHMVKALAKAGVSTMEEARLFKSASELVDELRHLGFGDKVTKVDCIKLLQKPAGAPGVESGQQSSRLGTEDLVEAVLGAPEPAQQPELFDPQLPLVSALLSGLSQLSDDQLDNAVKSFLTIAGIETVSDFDTPRNVELMLEALEDLLEEREVKAEQLKPPNGDAGDGERGARKRLKKALKSDASAAKGQQPPTPPADAAVSTQQFADMFAEATGRGNKASSLEDEAALERAARVAGDPQAKAALEHLQTHAKSAQERQLVDLASRAQQLHPELAALLHHENLKIPAGVNPATLPLGKDGMVVSVSAVREVARQAMQVAEALPGCIARASLAQKVAPQMVLNGTSGLESMTSAVWTGKVVEQQSSSFNIASMMQGVSSGSLLQAGRGGKKKADGSDATQFMLVFWPAISAAYGMAHPLDRDAERMLQTIGSLAMGDIAGASADDGINEVILPLLTKLRQDWCKQARGAAYPTIEKVWAATQSEYPQVASWISSSSLRSRFAKQVDELKSVITEQRELLSKLTTRVVQLERRPMQRQPNQQQQPQPTEPTDDGLTSRQRRAKLHREKQEAESATKPAAALKSAVTGEETAKEEGETSTAAQAPAAATPASGKGTGTNAKPFGRGGGGNGKAPSGS
jgi:hypothetical protein